MKIALRCSAVALALLAAGPAHADGDGAGTTSANFLSVGPGAAATGMGGTGVARAGSLDLLGWNAASLGFLGETQLAFSHAAIAEGTSQSWAALGGRLGGTRWAFSGLYQGEGSFEGLDSGGLPTGSFDVSSMAFGAHVARPLGGIVTAGLGAKYVGEKLGDVSGSGFAVDLGLQARLGPVALGVAAQNAFGEMKYDGAAYPLPENYAIGASVNVPGGLSLAVDANLPPDYYEDVRVGVEYRYLGMLAVRGGYRKELGAPEGSSLDGPSFGLGAGWGGLWLDYGYSLEGEGDAIHRMALHLKPGRMAPGTGLLGAGAEPEAKPARAPRPLAATPPVENEPVKSAATTSAPAKSTATSSVTSEPAKAAATTTAAKKVTSTASATSTPATTTKATTAKAAAKAAEKAATKSATNAPATAAAPAPVAIQDAELEASQAKRTTATTAGPAQLRESPARTAPAKPVQVDFAKARRRGAPTALPQDVAASAAAGNKHAAAKPKAEVAAAKPKAEVAAAKPRAEAETAKPEARVAAARPEARAAEEKSGARETKPSAVPPGARATPATEVEGPASTGRETPAVRETPEPAKASRTKSAESELAEPKAKKPKFSKVAGKAKHNKKKPRTFDDVARDAAKLAEKKTGRP